MGASVRLVVLVRLYNMSFAVGLISADMVLLHELQQCVCSASWGCDVLQGM